MNQDGLESHKLKSIDFRKAWFDNNAWNKQNIFFSQLEAGHLLFFRALNAATEGLSSQIPPSRPEKLEWFFPFYKLLYRHLPPRTTPPNQNP